MKEITFNKDQVIFRQGDDASVMYDIISGRVGIYTDYGAGQEKKLAELGEGELFGEMGMIEYFPRSATAVALEDGTVLAEIGESDLRAYFEDKPEKLLHVLRTLSHRLRETSEKYVDVCRVVSEYDRKNEETSMEECRRLQQEMDAYAAYYNYWMR